MLVVKLVATGLASFAGAAVIGVMAVAGNEVKRSGESIIELETAVDSLRFAAAQAMPGKGYSAGRPNVATDFNPDVERPTTDPSSFVDPLASVIGAVKLGKNVYVAPFASVRGDEGQPIYVGDDSNLQDGVVVHALETTQEGKPLAGRTYEVGGRNYAVYIGKRVSIAHQALVHGPARIDDNVFVGMQAMVFKAALGEGVVLEPGAKVIGVTIPPHRYVAAGVVVTDQKVADKLPKIDDAYPYRALNDAVVHVNTSFAEGYRSEAEARVAALEALKSRKAEGAGAKTTGHPVPKAAASHGEAKEH